MEYQKLEFGDTKIEGKDRYPEYKLIFPEPPVGKSILDVGCNMGYYCFQAATEGAKRCAGIDNSPAFIDVAKSVKGFDNVSFELYNIMDNLVFEKFDIVMMLYVFHHFTDIGQVYDSISKCSNSAKEMLVFGILDVKDNYLFEWQENRKGNKKIALSKLLFENLFSGCKVESIPSAIVKNRSIIKVYK